ncbi:MAG: anaerobic glycerol-3-phosphate dehydrogenase subunit GlpA [Deltaproteobacteria bacterium]|nr:anaerobic glycerol-3-phosphate dehydrogenase subunit GlpA [Deltaproteobacteria bacterium]
MDLETEVLIIGGGATGAGIARDLALRGIPCLLVEKGDFTSGASGRNQGLLHSGGRYAVNDPEAARECISENRILRRIAPHCIEATGGLFVSLPEDGAAYRSSFIAACEAAGIDTLSLTPHEALSLEPRLNPLLLGAVQVPDGAIDPFLLVVENARDAESRGAKVLLHTEVTGLIRDGGRIAGVRVRDGITRGTYAIAAPWVINATGAWVNRILGMAGQKIGIALSKGSMLITNTRLSERVINRCRPPASGDIVVPNDTVSILGTTSGRAEDLEHIEVTPEEVAFLVEELSQMIPAVAGERFTRAYAGVRPLVQAKAGDDDRAISRGFTLIDHAKSDGLAGLVTITGGKLITYRLMAEKTVDFLCERMGLHVPCVTHVQRLPGAGLSNALKDRLLRLRRQHPAARGEILCDCELVPKEAVDALLREGKVRDFQDVLHRTRLAKGTCQGGFCVYRLLGLLNELKMGERRGSNRILRDFLEERWKGIRPVLWGTSLKEEELIESIYKGLFNLGPEKTGPAGGGAP